MFKHTALYVAFSFALAACTPFKVSTESNVNIPEQFEQSNASTVFRQINLSRWWESWQDPILTDLIEKALSSNYSLAAARANLEASRAQARLADAEVRPQAGVSGNVSIMSGVDNPLPENIRQDIANAGYPAAEQNRFSSPNSQSIGTTISWEPDIFGQKRSDADAAHAIALGEKEQWHGAQMLITTDLAEHYFQVYALRQRISQAEKRVSLLNKLLTYVRARFKAGQQSAYDIRQAETQLSIAQSEIAVLKAQVDAHIRSIAVLVGQTPQGFKLPESKNNVLTHIPAPPSGAQPLDVLNRRPDTKAHELIVQARAAKLASAKADRYPRFDIQFMWERGRISLDSDLPSSVSTEGLFNAGMTIPLFTAGRIKANIQSADAQLKAALAEYNQNLLTALAEVDSSYQLQYGLSNQSLLTEKANQQAKNKAAQSRRLFQLGKLTLDQVLSAEVQASQTSEQLVQNKLAEAQNMLNLYKALGGGWRDESQ